MGVSIVPDITFFSSIFSYKDLPTSGLPEICISGRSNVGKSSMINRLANRRSLARISRKPGKTQSINYFLAGKAFYLVDLPGYGYAKAPKALRSFFAGLVNPYLNNRRELMGIIQLLDARHGPVSGDYEMLEWLKDWDGSVLYVFTKADKLSANGRMKVLKAFEEECGKKKDTVMFSARKGMGVEDVRAWIYTTLGIEDS